jgi:hypothetical protein
LRFPCDLWRCSTAWRSKKLCLNFDIAVFKDFPIRESVRAQFHMEMYNAFNHTQFTAVDNGARFDPQGNQVNPRFGEMPGAAPRRIQLALRFYF